MRNKQIRKELNKIYIYIVLNVITWSTAIWMLNTVIR